MLSLPFRNFGSLGITNHGSWLRSQIFRIASKLTVYCPTPHLRNDFMVGCAARPGGQGRDGPLGSVRSGERTAEVLESSCSKEGKPFKTLSFHKERRPFLACAVCALCALAPLNFCALDCALVTFNHSSILRVQERKSARAHRFRREAPHPSFRALEGLNSEF
jgi:hypothetical protein